MFGISGISTLHSIFAESYRSRTASSMGCATVELNRKDFEQHVIDYPDALRARTCCPLQGKFAIQFHSARPYADGSDPKKKQTRYRERDFTSRLSNTSGRVAFIPKLDGGMAPVAETLS